MIMSVSTRITTMTLAGLSALLLACGGGGDPLDNSVLDQINSVLDQIIASAAAACTVLSAGI